MKKQLLIFSFLFLSVTVLAQVKIGDNPNSIGDSSVLELESTNQALLITRVASTGSILSPVNGMLVYDLSTGCIRGFENGAWTDCVVTFSSLKILEQLGNEADNSSLYSSLTIAQLSSLGLLGVNPSYEANYHIYIDSHPNSFSSPATLLEAQAMINTVNAQQQVLQEILEDSASLGGANNANAISVSLVQLQALPLAGVIPSFIDAYQAAIHISAGFSNPPTIIEIQAIIDSVNQVSITSLDCSGATNNGNLVLGEPASGVNSVIPYTGGNGGAFSGETVVSTGVTGLTATLNAGTFVVGDGSLTYIITGTPLQSGIASFTLNIGGQTCTLTRTVARNCSVKINSTDFKQFMCYNLGADTSLDPHVPVVGLQGAYIQWGKRGPNTTGDASLDWQTAANDGTLGFAATPTAGNDNASTIFGWSTVAASDYSWRTVGGAKTANDPCPTGYRVPTIEEWSAVNTNNTLSRTGTWSASNTNYGAALHFGPDSSTKWLTLPATGFRGSDHGGLSNRGMFGVYWASNESGSTDGSVFAFISNSSFSTLTNRLFALSVRCIKE